MSEMTAVKSNAISWFEIPTLNIDRATRFYETILGTKLMRTDYGERMSIFPASNDGIKGTLVQREDQRPGRRGTLIYLNCDGTLDEVAERVPSAGGSVVVPVTVIEGGFGRYATIRDTEGNQISLHTR